MVNFVQHRSGLVLAVEATKVSILFFYVVHQTQHKLSAVQLVSVCTYGELEGHGVSGFSASRVAQGGQQNMLAHGQGHVKRLEPFLPKHEADLRVQLALLGLAVNALLRPAPMVVQQSAQHANPLPAGYLLGMNVCQCGCRHLVHGVPRIVCRLRLRCISRHLFPQSFTSQAHDLLPLGRPIPSVKFLVLSCTQRGGYALQKFVAALLEK